MRSIYVKRGEVERGGLAAGGRGRERHLSREEKKRKNDSPGNKIKLT